MSHKEFKVVIIMLFGVVAFMYGALTTGLQIFPYKYVEPYIVISNSLMGAASVQEYNEKVRWELPKPDQVETVIYKPEFVEKGAVLYTTTHDTKARLIDHKGRELYSWSYDFSAVWPDQEHVISLATLEDKFFYSRDFHLYENGDILLMATAAGVTPWGMGLVKLDKDSNVIWSFTGYPNNDFEVAPDGTIYVINHEIREDDLDNNTLPITPFLEDNILILSPDGKEIKSVSIMDAIDHSKFKDMFKNVPDEDSGDPTHSNSLTYFKADHPTIPWIKEGYIMVSIRNINAMAVIDPESEEVVHAYRLQTNMQHDLDYLGNGNFMVFDNRGSYTEGGFTRVLEFHPETQEVFWQYDPQPDASDVLFESEFWGAQQRLENGNTLIVHAALGRLIEVTPNADIVWDYRVPFSYTKEDGGEYIPVITSAEKIDPAQYPFLILK